MVSSSFSPTVRMISKMPSGGLLFLRLLHLPVRLSLSYLLSTFCQVLTLVGTVGVIAGPHLLGPSTTGLHPRDYKLFQQMNTLAGVAGVGEGFLPAHMLGMVENGARLVAGRIPT